uniref:Malate dehydrogenase n=1 Tax=Cryptococcus bacillisporus CA1280 TaxID=1296109 RepID=A0A0D0VCG0_CRYGA|nr:hypothetical protein I312_06643 [Cryptococcus bacillisporus CA1280]
MTLSYPIPGLVVLFPTIVLSFPSSLNPSSYLSNLSASPLNIVRTLPQSCSNYTCNSGAYVSIGALANLFDVTCLYALTAGGIDPSFINSILPKMIDMPGSTSAGSISPEFVTDTDRVLVSKAATLDDPYNAAINVPWLELVAVESQGTYAKCVFRTNTFQGQPPSSCTTENAEISVQYASMYWFTK